MLLMKNSTQLSYFILGAFFDTGHLRSFCFLVVLLLYVCIVGANLLLIVLICVNRSLHEPMYLFLCSLCVNELYGSTGLFPFLLLHILSEVHIIPAPLCFLQIFSVYSYGTVEYYILAVMSYDRYLAICYPLHYTVYTKGGKVCQLIAFSWLCPFISVSLLPVIISSLHFCRNIISKVYCDYYSVVKLSCYDTTLLNIYGQIHFLFFIFSPLSLIIYTYSKIFKVCFSGCKQSRQKVLSTCTPHLASLINFTCGASFEIFQSRFDMSGVPNMLRVFLSLYFLTCPPLLNPVLYGLNLSKIRVSCRKMMSCSGRQRSE